MFFGIYIYKWKNIFLNSKKCSDMNYGLYTAQRGAEESALRGEASTQRAERPEPLTS